jgi:CheY-like chemotaxis protein
MDRQWIVIALRFPTRRRYPLNSLLDNTGGPLCPAAPAIAASLRQVVGIALKSAGYDVIEARDGDDALVKLTVQKLVLP